MRKRYDGTASLSKNSMERAQTYLVNHVYMQTNAAVTASLFCACITFIGFFSLRGDNHALLTWFAIYLSVTIFRVILVHRFESKHIEKHNVKYWYNLYLLSAFLTGVVWGFPAFSLMPQASEIQQVLMLLILGGLTSGVVPFLSPLPTAAMLYLFFAITPYIISFAFMQKNIYILFDASLIMYLLYSIFLVMKSNENIKSSVHLKFENEQLRRQVVEINRQLEISNKKLEIAVTHDKLTHVANWDLFAIKLNEGITQARLNHGFLALMYIDIDDFKRVNACYNHQTGDYILLVIVERLKNFFGCDEMIARLGSDEFVVILEYMIDVDAVSNIAKQLCQLLSEPIKVNAHDIKITVSIGVSIFPDDGGDIQALLSAASKRRVYVKEQGGNAYFSTTTHTEMEACT